MLRGQATLFLAYLQTMEGFLETEVQRLLSEQEEIESGLEAHETDVTPDNIDIWNPPETPSEIEELLNEIRIIEQFELPLVEEFSNLLRKSIFVGLYGFLESTLVQECFRRRGSGAQAIMDGVRGSVVRKAATCLGYSLGANSDWGEIENYRKLRNCIVHSAGALDRVKNRRNRRSLEKYIHNESALSLSQKGFVALRKGFCESAVQTVERFLFSVVLDQE